MVWWVYRKVRSYVGRVPCVALATSKTYTDTHTRKTLRKRDTHSDTHTTLRETDRRFDFSYCQTDRHFTTRLPGIQTDRQSIQEVLYRARCVFMMISVGSCFVVRTPRCE